MLDIISIGDPTIDTLLEVEDATVVCKLDHEDCQICFDYAEKIPVESINVRVAGNSTNNAIGCSRLGLKAAFYMIVGNDGQGRAIADKLRKEKIRDDYFVIDKKNPTNASTVINYHGERTILVYHAPRKYSLPKLQKSKWIYYSSVNTGHKKLNKQILAHSKKNNVKLCYNPGTFQRLAGVPEMQRVAKQCEIVFVNKEEARELSKSTSHNISTILKAMHKIGMKMAVITDGPKGSYVYDGTDTYHMGILPTPVIERTGAGDGYALTFISMLHKGKSIPEAMCMASTNASSVIMEIGPQDGLLKEPALRKMHKKYAHTCAVKI